MDNPKEFTCTKCNKKFNRKFNLDRHTKSCNTERIEIPIVVNDQLSDELKKENDDLKLELEQLKEDMQNTEEHYKEEYDALEQRCIESELSKKRIEEECYEKYIQSNERYVKLEEKYKQLEERCKQLEQKNKILEEVCSRSRLQRERKQLTKILEASSGL